MKIRSLTLFVLVSVLTLTLTANIALAGGIHHERWKGIAIGIGAAILGSAILNHNNYYPPREYEHCYVPTPPPVKQRSYHKGHWEVRDEWVPPVYKTVWNPAHYNQNGEWVEGTWIKIIDKQGYWTEKRVWVAATEIKYRTRY